MSDIEKCSAKSLAVARDLAEWRGGSRQFRSATRFASDIAELAAIRNICQEINFLPATSDSRRAIMLNSQKFLFSFLRFFLAILRVDNLILNNLTN